MKKNRFFTGVMCTLAVVALSACGQEAQEQLQYVSLSQAGCTFFGTDNEPLAVTVETSPAQWAAEASASWVKAEPGEDGTTLVLSVEDNDGDAERKAAVTVTAGQAVQEIGIRQLAADGAFARFRKLDTFSMGAAMSPSGRYAGGFVISIAPDGKIALSIKQTQPAPERAPRAPRSPRPQGQQGSNGGVRPAGGRPPRREAAPRVWQPKPSQPQGDLSFEDMMARYKTQSEEKIADLKRVTENHRGGYSRRRG